MPSEKINKALVTDSRSNSSHIKFAKAGIIWVSVSIFVAKILAFGSQILLGHLLKVDTYAYFAIASTTTIIVAGFQDPGVSKILIQKQEEFGKLVKSYFTFSLYSSIIGVFIYIISGFYLEKIYKLDNLSIILIITAISSPFQAASSIYLSKLSTDYKFKLINIIDIIKSITYYALVIIFAYYNFEYYTISLASLASSIIQLFALSKFSENLPLKWHINLSEIKKIIKDVKWIFFSTVLMALTMKLDYLILGKFLTKDEIGYYYFGFMLVANITVLISSGVNQTFLPIFSKIKNNADELKSNFLSLCNGSVIFTEILCIGIICIVPSLVNAIWGGKWDASNIIIVTITIAMPLRMFSILSFIGIEANGSWRLRTTLLIIEIIFLALLTYFGALLGGYTGAAISVALQRAISGFAAFNIYCKSLNINSGSAAKIQAKLILPFAISIAALLSMNTIRIYEISNFSIIVRLFFELILSIALFLAITYALNKKSLLMLTSFYKRRNS